MLIQTYPGIRTALLAVVLLGAISCEGGGGNLLSPSKDALMWAETSYNCPTCQELDDQFFQMMETSIGLMCEEMHAPAMGALYRREWGFRPGRHYATAWHYRENDEKDQSNPTKRHLAIAESHPGWDPGSGLTTLQRYTSVATSQVHELYHHLNPAWDDTMVWSATRTCVPGAYNY
jgi:hypothetical protein